jgi:hypothetical protein
LPTRIGKITLRFRLRPNRGLRFLINFNLSMHSIAVSVQRLGPFPLVPAFFQELTAPAMDIFSTIALSADRRLAVI